MVKNPLDFKLGVGLTLFCLILFFYLIPKHVGPISEPDTFMPMMATVFIQILAVILIIQACGSSKIDQSQSLEKKGNSVKLLAGVVVIMVIYAWLLDLTGFLLTSSAENAQGRLGCGGVEQWQLDGLMPRR
ncbi:MAG: tripartite tricarboxylate transporter TctB family protein, partial [bacterium]